MSMAHQRVFECTEVGIFAPQMRPTERARIGGVGYVIANIKIARRNRRRRYDYLADDPAHMPLAGYRKAVPMVYCGLYPNEGAEYDDLRDALEKLKLNDAALVYEPETRSRWASASAAVSWACCTWRSSKSASNATTGLDLIATSPSVVFRVTKTDGAIDDHRQPVEAAGDELDSLRSKSRTSKRRSSRRPITSARSWRSRRTGAARLRTWNTCTTAA